MSLKLIKMLLQALPGSDLSISCRRNNMTPGDVVDTLVKIMKEMASDSPYITLPDSHSSVLALVKGKLMGLTNIERKGEAVIKER